VIGLKESSRNCKFKNINFKLKIGETEEKLKKL